MKSESIENRRAIARRFRFWALKLAPEGMEVDVARDIRSVTMAVRVCCEHKHLRRQYVLDECDGRRWDDVAIIRELQVAFGALALDVFGEEARTHDQSKS